VVDDEGIEDGTNFVLELVILERNASRVKKN